MGAASDAELGRLRVLAVDDDIFMLDLIRAGLNGIGVWQFEAASDGIEGIRKISRFQPDVVICDLNMPGMDGVAFLRHLAERSFLGGLFILSGEDDFILRTAQDLARQHGLNLLGAASKPVEVGELRSVLTSFLQDEFSPQAIPRTRYRHAELRRAIVNNEIVPYFQPQIDSRTGACVGVEALARWIHPEDGLVLPDLFIALAEETGLISALTETIFRQSMQAAFRFQRRFPTVRLALNLSTLALQRTWLPDMFTEQAELYGVPPSKITLEVTESNVIEDMALSLEVLTRLRLRGFGLAIDDFGTGYASMQQLRRIPFTELKIDRTFVHDVDGDGVARAILDSSVSLGKRMDLTIVAEGVENQADWDRVTTLGCDVVQGWFHSVALPEDRLEEWLETTNGPEAEPAAGRARAHKASVLVVDDSGFQAGATARILTRLGVEVEVAESGAIALERMADGPVDLILMDVQMPEMDGFETTARLREQFGDMVPVVGLSGAVNDELQVQAASAGMSDLVEKSFDSDILGSLIRKWLPWVRRWAAAPTLPSQRSGEADQPSPETAFDLSVLQSATGADEGELQEFADRAVQDISDAAAVLVHSARAADARHCRSVAHRAKGSARVIGAQRAARVLDEIEAAALSGSIEDVRGLLDRLSDELTLLSDAREAVR